MKYGQFCPIAKATEILGEKWTFLIIRELLMGRTRFNVMQRGLGDISPALLTSRLKSLQDQGMVVRRKLSGQKGYEYFPTPACQSLLPLLVQLGEWGLCWAKDNVLDEEVDPELLMLYLERSVDPEQIPGRSGVIRFRFTDLTDQKDFWLLVKDSTVDLCITDPGREVDVYFQSTLCTMKNVWMGDRSYKEAMSSGDLDVTGDPALTRNIRNWLKPSIFEQSPREPAPA